VIMIGLAFVSMLICGFAFVGLIITGGPTVWLLTGLFTLWLGGRVWRWLQQTTPVPVDEVLPSRWGP
jgi:hypothetical protein